jgi:hypothetical protein
LVVLAYLKNYLLTTLEPTHLVGRKGANMRKVKLVSKLAIASASEVILALGIGLLASVWPLSQVNFVTRIRD